MVTVSKDVFSNKGPQIKYILLCHNGLVYSSKTKVDLIFPKVSRNIKAKTMIKTVM